MLDQNTDRMWYVIGALVVGAGLILMANKFMPESFAKATESFKTVMDNGIDSVKSLSINSNDIGNQVESYDSLEDYLFSKYATHPEIQQIYISHYELLKVNGNNYIHNTTGNTYTKSDENKGNFEMNDIWWKKVEHTPAQSQVPFKVADTYSEANVYLGKSTSVSDINQQIMFMGEGGSTYKQMKNQNINTLKTMYSNQGFNFSLDEITISGVHYLIGNVTRK